ncbi:hypothetical protein EP331_00660 [bacterium]|nr:MAG: hypothetical protein EP331_00660 [bacterium]
MKRKLIFIVVIGTILAFALADALDLFTEKDYLMIPHGSHNHYLPLNRDESIPVHNYPMEPPKENEMITPDGRIVKKPGM